MYILTILACPYVIRNRFFKTQASLNPISMNIYFAIKEYSFPLQLKIDIPKKAPKIISDQ